MIRLHRDSADHTRGRRGHLSRIGGIGLRMSTLNDSERAIAHIDFTGLPVQFKEERARAIGVWLADGQKLDDE